MRPRTLKQKLFLTVSILVITSGMCISLLVTQRYSASLIQGAVAQTENIAHNLALDAVDKILINDLVALQKLLDDQMRSNPTIAYVFVVKDGRVVVVPDGDLWIDDGFDVHPPPALFAVKRMAQNAAVGILETGQVLGHRQECRLDQRRTRIGRRRW